MSYFSGILASSSDSDYIPKGSIVMLAVHDILRGTDINFDVIDYNNPDMIFLNVFKSLSWRLWASLLQLTFLTFRLLISRKHLSFPKIDSQRYVLVLKNLRINLTRRFWYQK